MIRYIKSPQNETFKFLKGMKDPQKRKETGSFLLEGITLVEEVLRRSNLRIRFVVFSEDFEDERNLSKKSMERGIPVLILKRSLFREISLLETPQGILAVAEVPIPDFEEFDKKLREEIGCVVVLEDVQDPQNVGAVIRVVDAVSGIAVYYTQATADPFSPKAVRASAGSILNVPLIKVRNVIELLESLKFLGFKVLATVVEGGNSVFKTVLPRKSVIVVGNESKGITQEILERADHKVTIPMLGKVQSLNVAVATGIVLYEWARQVLRI